MVIDLFTTKEAARYAQESADPMLTAEQRADALAIAQSGGHIKRWFAIQLQMASLAERDIPAIEEEIDLMRQEGFEEVAP